MTAETGPTPPTERIVSLDVLRGGAVLGILLINVWLFSMPESVLFNPTVYGDFTGVNYWSWFLSHVFAELKFITLFSALFGAGIVLFVERKQSATESALALHFRRTVLLILIGLVHAYLLWYGDILVSYGLCGLGFVFLARREPSVQAALGLVFLAVPSVLNLSLALSTGTEAVAGQWAPAETVIRNEIATYRGGWVEQLSHRLPAAVERQTSGFIGQTLWRVGGTVLLGMAFYRWGVFSGDRSARLYRLLLAGGVVGLLVIVAGVRYIEANDWSADAALFWRQFNYWASLLVAGGYVAVGTRYTQWRPDGAITRALAAVGRMAFTNYLLQTVVATTVFYGHGLGLFGAVSRAEALVMVGCFWAVQVVLSVLWLRVFRFGPVEWLWRTLTYGEKQRLRRSE